MRDAKVGGGGRREIAPFSSPSHDRVTATSYTQAHVYGCVCVEVFIFF